MMLQCQDFPHRDRRGRRLRGTPAVQGDSLRSISISSIRNMATTTTTTTTISSSSSSSSSIGISIIVIIIISSISISSSSSSSSSIIIFSISWLGPGTLGVAPRSRSFRSPQ